MAPEAITNEHKEYLERSIDIKATAEHVWKALFKKRHFERWSKAFSDNATVESEWKLGGSIKFVDSNGSGIVGTIKACEPFEELSIRFECLLKNGKEDKESDKAKKWIGCHENFFLVEGQTETILTVEEDVPQERLEGLTSKWDAALREIKSIAEEMRDSAGTWA